MTWNKLRYENISKYGQLNIIIKDFAFVKLNDLDSNFDRPQSKLVYRKDSWIESNILQMLKVVS